MLRPEIVLDRLQQYLSSALRAGTVVLSRAARDGRIDSQENERQLSHALQLYALSNEWFAQENLQLKVSPARFWCDFSVTGPENFFLPVNVKVSALKTADNISSKEGVFYALTGVLPSAARINNWDAFFEQLALYLGSNPSADYYFMVVGKNDPGDVFWTGLKRIPELRANGNNPPFQCHWGRNRLHENRDQRGAERYVLSVLRETFRLRAEAFRSFERHCGTLV